MLNINRALENDRLLRSLTGLNRKAFEQLCEVFEAAYQEGEHGIENPANEPEAAAGKPV